MAVEYQLHGERNLDVFRTQRHRETVISEAHIGFMGFMFQKWKYYVPGVLVTLIPGILRGWEISFLIKFPESKQNIEKSPEVFNLNTNEDKNLHFLVVIHSLSYTFHLLKLNVNVILCFSKVSLAKTS